MRTFCILIALGALSATTPLRAASTIILGDGGNLPAAVAAAQHGDVIELRSNGSFGGNLSWQDKYITIQAGTGFQPLLEGDIGSIHGNALTGGTFRGLTINGGFGASSTGTRFATYVFEDSTIHGDVTIGGTGEFHVNATARDSKFLGGTNLAGTGGFNLEATFERNVFDDFFFFGTISTAVHEIDFVANDFLIRPVSGGGGVNTSRRELSFTRNVLREGIDIAVGEFNNLNVRLSDNMIGSASSEPSTAEPGILLRSLGPGTGANVTGTFVNNTVVGFDVGIERRLLTTPTSLNLDFVNMLLDNTDDLVNVAPEDISYSLISDGTYAGLNNNFSGTPVLGSDGRLLAGSVGIDRGNNGRASNVDIEGRPRIVDGNGDGVPVVDVGAHEFVIPEPTSLVLCLCLAVLSLAPRGAIPAHPPTVHIRPARGCRSTASTRLVSRDGG